MELLRDMYESWQMMDLHNSIITMGRTHSVFETSKQVRVKWNIWNKKRCDAKRPRQQEHRSVRSSNSNQPICDNDLSSIISFPLLYLTFIYFSFQQWFFLFYTCTQYMCIVNCTIVIRSIFLDSSFWTYSVGRMQWRYMYLAWKICMENELEYRFFLVLLFIARFKIIGCQRHTPSLQSMLRAPSFIV